MMCSTSSPKRSTGSRIPELDGPAATGLTRVRLEEVDARSAAASLLRRMDRARVPTELARAQAPSPTVALSEDQAVAVAEAERAIGRRGGVLLAHRTGSGKTHIAIALIERALEMGDVRSVLVTSPAALSRLWIPLLRRVGRAWGSRVIARTSQTTVQLPVTSASASGRALPTIAWCSHAALSRGLWPVEAEACDLVIADEAHAFRNPASRRHVALGWLCRRARVVLLTATPVNNSLLDLYFLFRLFIGDGELEDLGVPDLAAAFRHSASGRGRLPPLLGAAIDALTVRGPDRGRLKRAALEGRPRHVECHSVRYDLDAGRPGRVSGVMAAIRDLELGAYRVGPAARTDSTGGELLRYGLVKRLESSRAAFLSSARGMVSFLEAFAAAAADGFWLSPRMHRALSSGAPGQLLLAPLALPRLPAPFSPEALVPAARRDAARLRQTIDGLTELRMDPKSSRLIQLLQESTGQPGVLIFTEYRATAEHLWRRLRNRYRTGLITGSFAAVGAGRAPRFDVVSRFAPRANGRRLRSPADALDILIATDVLAEGFNLQDAADVVSYDLPWNPVRLIQRVGRIDRIGSGHTVVRVHNFIPDRTLDSMIRLVDRIGRKLAAIRAGPGRESAEHSVRWDLEGRPRFRSGRIRRVPKSAALISTTWVRDLDAGAPDLMNSLEIAAHSIVGPLFSRIGDGILGVDARPGDHAGGAGRDPAGRVDRSVGDNEDTAGRDLTGWIVAIAEPGGRDAVRLLAAREQAGGSGGSRIAHEGVATADLLQAVAAVAEGRRPARAFASVGIPTQPGAGLVLADSCEAGRRAAAAISAVLAPRTPRLGEAASRVSLARSLFALVALEPGGPDAVLCRRADAVAARLRAGLRAGAESAVADLLSEAMLEAGQQAGRVSAVLEKIEALVGSGASGSSSSRSQAITVFELQPFAFAGA